MREIPVGEFVTLGDEVYKCVEYQETYGVACSLCDFYATDLCENYNCVKSCRTDIEEVMFILYDNISGSDEPFISEDNASD